MYNKSGINTGVYLPTSQILADVDNQMAIGCIIPQKMGYDVGKYKIVRAGTPIVINPMDDIKVASEAGGYDESKESRKTPGFWLVVYSPTLDLEVDLERCGEWLRNNATEEDWNYYLTRAVFNSKGTDLNMRYRTTSWYYPSPSALGITILSGKKGNATIYMPFYNYLREFLIKDKTSVSNLTLVSKEMFFKRAMQIGIEYASAYFTIDGSYEFTKLPNGNTKLTRTDAAGSATDYDLPLRFDDLIPEFGFEYTGNFVEGDTFSVKLCDGDLPPKRQMNSVTLTDVDVTDGDGCGSALLFGTVNVNRVDPRERNTLLDAIKDYTGHTIRFTSL